MPAPAHRTDFSPSASPSRPVSPTRTGSEHLLRRFAGLCFLALLTLVPAAVTGQDPLVLSGTVTDPSGRGVPGASVEVRGPAVRTAVTDRAGRFRFESLPSGTYLLSVEGLGIQGSEAREVELGPETAPVELRVDAAPIAIDPLRVVTTVRGGRPATTLPAKIDVIEAEAVVTQQSLATNPTELLSNLIPSFSPGRQKLTSSGESFRGRRPLFLVDGVPQSNPLRDGRRDGFTIGMDMIERVEVVFGANAIQGLGATGGIVNYITADPPA